MKLILLLILASVFLFTGCIEERLMSPSEEKVVNETFLRLNEFCKSKTQGISGVNGFSQYVQPQHTARGFLEGVGSFKCDETLYKYAVPYIYDLNGNLLAKAFWDEPVRYYDSNGVEIQ